MKDWRTLTQAELDAAYDQRLHAPNMASVLQALAEAGSAAQQRLPQRLRLAHGSGQAQALDWYPCGQAQAPVFFFVHGGAWRNGQARDNAFFVEWMLARGVDVVIPDFPAVTELNGDLGQMVTQVAQAWSLAAAHAARPMHLCGHSSGAHLAACLATDAALAGQVASLTLCSGLYELEPVSLSSRSSYVTFTPELVRTLSPLRHIERLQADVTLLCGTRESPEFMRQSQALQEALQAAGRPSKLLWGEGLNHFEILQTLEQPPGLFAQAVQDAW